MSYKDSQRQSREAVRKVTDLYEGDKSKLYDEKGNLTPEGLQVLFVALNSPNQHNTVNLDIKAFKRFLKGIPMITKSMINQQVREYKDKAWKDYAEIVKFKGSFPSTRTI